MEIVILGFVLFIVGVSATIIYDKYKLNLNRPKQAKSTIKKTQSNKEILK